MDSRSPPVVEYLSKPFDDADYDMLLQKFACDHPAELQVWHDTERQLFENRKGLGAYPDQQLRDFCLDFLRPKLDDELGGLGPSVAWGVLRGRLLRALIDKTPDLNPAPGRVLITVPRTCSDKEIVSLVETFSRNLPTLWAEWERIEAEGIFEDFLLREVSTAFRYFLYAHCWVQTSTAVSTAFMAARGLFFYPAKKLKPLLASPQ